MTERTPGLQAEQVVRTFRYRVRDKHAAELQRMARSVNTVWNFCAETQRTAVARGSRWPSYFELTGLVTGATGLGIPMVVIYAVCRRYVNARAAAGRTRLRFRGRRSLGWVPFRILAKGTSLRTDGLRWRNKTWELWLTRGLPKGARIADGSNFSSDARGRWYLNLVAEVPMTETVRVAGRSVGIDLGLKSLATLSTGETIVAPQHFRRGEKLLAKAHRAGKKRLAAARSAKIANQRRDHLHKLSTRLVGEFDSIYVGDVSSSRLAKTRMAKSILDAGWSTFRGFLSYKAIAQGVIYREVNEAGSTMTCSDCGLVGGPRGRKGLVVREWTCGGCGVVHDRDVNAAQNILRWACPAPTGALGVSPGRHEEGREEVRHG